MKRQHETRAVFINRITTAVSQDEGREEGDEDADPESSQDKRWAIGFKTRSRGSLHVDLWADATAAEVATCGLIAVYPTMGWWRTRKHLGFLEKHARYSLVVSIESADQNVDIYTPVAVKVAVPIAPIILV